MSVEYSSAECVAMISDCLNKQSCFTLQLIVSQFSALGTSNMFFQHFKWLHILPARN